MRKFQALAAITATFILCLGLACCSTQEDTTEDEAFSFGHAEVIRKETTTTTEIFSQEDFFWELIIDDPDLSQENESTEADDTTTAQATTKPRRTTTTKPTSDATSAPTTAATTVPTTSKPVVTLPPEIEYPSATTTLTVEDSEDGEFESELLSLVNAERSKKSLATLKYSAELAQAADIRARELTQTFSHNRPDGSTCFTVSEYVYGENIAAGQTSPASVISAWMNSEGHKKNILNETYKSAAIGCYNDGETYYWVLLFGY